MIKLKNGKKKEDRTAAEWEHADGGKVLTKKQTY